MSKSQKTLYTLGHCFGAGALYDDLFDTTVMLSSYDPTDVRAAGRDFTSRDVILFGGGEDISPHLYGASLAQESGAESLPSSRDCVERLAFDLAQSAGARSFGICRGAQLLCALSGGSLIQHVTNHQGNHWITTDEGKLLQTTSVHHQMMWPYTLPKNEYQLVAWCSTPRSKIYVFDPQRKLTTIDHPEPEVVFFPKTQSLGIQGHPEFMSAGAELVRYSRKLLEKYFQL